MDLDLLDIQVTQAILGVLRLISNNWDLVIQCVLCHHVVRVVHDCQVSQWHLYIQWGR